MKKTLLLSLAATGLAFSSFAQSKIDVRELRLGAYVAPTISWMRPTASEDDKGQFNVENNGSKIGFTWGLMVDYNFADNYALVTGLQLNTTGGKVLATAKDQSAGTSKVLRSDFNYRLNYLEIPVAIKLRTDPISSFRFFGQLGITTGFNIGKKATYNVDFYNSNGVKANAIGDNVKLKGSIGAAAPVMFQMNIGAGAEYPINNKLTAYAGLFFNNGFAPDATKPEKYDLNYDGEFRDANTRLNNFALRLGLFF